jgi:hypothetical protein
LLSFTIVYFFESGLFNGLQAIQIKKFPRVSGSVNFWSALVGRLPILLVVRRPSRSSIRRLEKI